MAASPAPFLDGAGGRLARSKPQLEDDASATDLRNNGRRRNQKHTLKEKEEIRTWLGLGLGLGLGIHLRSRSLVPEKTTREKTTLSQQRRRTAEEGQTETTNSHNQRDLEGR